MAERKNERKKEERLEVREKEKCLLSKQSAILCHPPLPSNVNHPNGLPFCAAHLSQVTFTVQTDCHYVPPTSPKQCLPP